MPDKLCTTGVHSNPYKRVCCKIFMSKKHASWPCLPPQSASEVEGPPSLPEFSSSQRWSLSQADMSLLHLTSETAYHTLAASYPHLLLSALVLPPRMASNLLTLSLADRALSACFLVLPSPQALEPPHLSFHVL